MAAPSGTTWGAIVNSYARIGLYVTTSNNSNNTQTTVTCQVWFWSKYSVNDSNNTMYFNWDSTSASSSVGSVSINTDVDTGSGWSTSNQQLMKTYTKTYSRGTSNATKNVAAALSGIEVSSGTMRVTKSFTIPALAKYTVTYNANGGTGAPGSQSKYYGVTLKLSSTIPTRDGYRFVGWGTSSGATSASYQPGGNYTSNASITLYAVWTVDSYIISYNANGGDGAPANQAKKKGTALTLSNIEPTRKRHNFLGWSTNRSATSASYQPGGSFTTDADTVLYAVWQLTDDYILIYKTGTCEAVEFIEDSLGVMFQDGGKVHATEFIETDDGISIGGIMKFGELEEV